MRHPLRIVALIAVGSVLFFVQPVKAQQPPEDLPTLETLQPKPLRPIREEGHIESSRSVIVGNPVSGRRTVVSVVREGQQVKKGDLVVELDSSDLRDKLNEVKIQLAQTHSVIGKLKFTQTEGEELRKVELARAELQLKTAQLALERYLKPGGEFDVELKELERTIQLATVQEKLAAQQLDRMRRLKEDGAIPASTEKLSELEITVLESRTQVESTKDQLKLLKEFQHPHKASLLKLEVLDAQLKLTQLRNTGTKKQAAMEAEFNALTQQLETQMEQLGIIKRDIEQCRLFATVDGTVVYPRPTPRTGPLLIGEGAVVRERQRLLSIVDTTQLQIPISVNESQVTQLQKGQAAIIRVDAFPEQQFTGVVSRVAERPDPNQFRQPREGTFVVTIQLTGDVSRLKLGLTAQVEIPSEKPKDD